MRASRFLRTAAAVSVVLFAATAFSTTVQANNEFYQVTNVQSDDSLNIRSAAGAQSGVIGTIPANGRTILTTGNTQQVGNSTWMEVVWLGQIGWVNSYYLSNDAAPAVQQVQPQQRKPAQVNYNYQSSDTSYQAPVANTGAQHTHPANRCTRSISHTHPNGSGTHSHRYSCQPGQQQAQPMQQQNVNAGQTHTHPANRCTRSISHTHPINGGGAHSHRYSCQPGQQQQAQPMQQNMNVGQGHTHPANRCTRSVSHTHPNGAGNHSHRYSCQQGQQQQAAPQYQQPAPQAQQMSRPKYNPVPKYNTY